MRFFLAFLFPLPRLQHVKEHIARGYSGLAAAGPIDLYGLSADRSELWPVREEADLRAVTMQVNTEQNQLCYSTACSEDSVADTCM